MKAGKLRHYVAIEEPVKGLSESGDATTTWKTFARVYADIEPLKGKEFWDAQMMQPMLTHKVRIRYLSGVTSDMRLIHESRTLHIQSPPTNLCEHDSEMVLMCTEKT